MSKAYTVKASRIEYDGTVGPHARGSGRITNAAALVQGVMYVAECDLYIEQVIVNIDTAFTHASSKLNIGSNATPTAYLVGMVTFNIGAGTFYFNPASYLGATGRTIPKGATFGFTMDAADVTGKLTASMIVRPATA